MDALRVALIGKTILSEGELEVLGHPESADDFAHAQPDPSLTLQGAFASLGGSDDRIELALGGLQERLTSACALLGQEGILTDDEPLAGIGRTRDLGQISLIEDRELDSFGPDQLTDGRRA